MARALTGLALLMAAAAGTAQEPPPPRPGSGSSSTPPPPPRPPIVRPSAPAPPPPPILVATSDMDCTLELDGEVIGTLQKDVVQEFTVRSGDHLLQAFPAGIEGPTWKETLKAPETGRVVAVIELTKVVEDFQKSQLNLDRFSVGAASVVDNESGLVWTKNVSPEMRWQEVAGYCERQRVDGASGWRLPSIDELSSLYYPDHPEPKQETTRPQTQRVLFMKVRGDMEIQPRLIFQPFDHNSVSGIWVQGAEERVLCTFLGEFTCSTVGKKDLASVFCVRPVG